jgi:glutaminyl-tRNA synthetase
MAEVTDNRPSDFIRDIVAADVKAGKYGGKVCTRFPPEPNGYLHIGHAKSICLNFGIAQDFGGPCHLRMDDTNPTTEDPEYVESMQRDIRWLGFDWNGKMFYASDYFEQLYEWAEKLIRLGRAYVCNLSEEQMSEYRGDPNDPSKPGRDSPYRTRTVEENLELFRQMRAGKFKDGECVLRAKIDMASPNFKMRDPPLYRIKHAHHYRQGDKWCIYPLYDYAHCLSDSIEGITHSICTMEFESARELYDWVVAATEVPHVPHQYEFARLNISYTVLSKRYLKKLVEDKMVSGWDDPRMPTLSGMRRRGFTPEALRNFCYRIGVARNLSLVDVGLLEYSLREDLDAKSPRVLAVLRPLKLTIENYPEGKTEEMDAPYWPAEMNRTESRKVPFTRSLFIERDDFAENPPKDWKRLAPGRQVRLRHGYLVTCTGVVKDARGEITEVKCSYDPSTKGGAVPAGKKVDGTIHWASAEHSLPAEVRLYDRLFTAEVPGSSSNGDFNVDLNPNSLEVVKARVEPSLASAKSGERFQFERQGFFYVDPDSKAGSLVFNRTITLKDSWAKVTSKAQSPQAAAESKTKKPSKQGGNSTSEKPELSAEAKALQQKHGLSDDETRAFASEPVLLALLESAVAAKAPTKPVAALLANDVLGEMRTRKLTTVPFGGAEVAELVSLLDAGTLSSKLAKEVLSEMFSGGGKPKAIVQKKGLTQLSGDELSALVTRVLAANADVVARYKAGNANVMGALVGLVMRESGGRANPKALSDELKKKLA